MKQKKCIRKTNWQCRSFSEEESEFTNWLDFFYPNEQCHSFSDEQWIRTRRNLKPYAEHEILSSRTPNTIDIVFQTSTRKIQSNLKSSAERETNIKDSKVYCNSLSKPPRRNILIGLNLFTPWELEKKSSTQNVIYIFSTDRRKFTEKTWNLLLNMRYKHQWLKTPIS